MKYKFLVIIMAVILLLCGCKSNPQSPAGNTTPTNQSGVPTESEQKEWDFTFPNFVGGELPVDDFDDISMPPIQTVP